MPESDIEILPIYLNKVALAGGVSTANDDTSVIQAENRTVSAYERSDTVQRSWQLSWSRDYSFITKLFAICRMSKGFLFVSSKDEERQATGQPLRNTVTGLNVGDGTTKTFQLQYVVSLPKDIGGGSSSSDPVDVNYPLAGTVTAYKNGVAASLDDVNLLTGVITFSSAPGADVVPTADYERAFPARFTSGVAQTLMGSDRTEVRSVQIEEIL
jgi:uncharacterized protein (TIGR02217 family)